ncbi:MAG: glutamate--cysteine ligase [Gemmatimonadetes bacterium]|nr:glutamate--cysteine ligase [Gemmatimonadota bacterium]
MTSESRARAKWVSRYLSEHCFNAPAHPSLTFGAELELLAFDAHTKAIAPIFPAADTGCTIDFVREVAQRLSWHETLSDKGVPRFSSEAGGSLTFEPGGQIEYASAVHRSIDGVLRELCGIESQLREHAQSHGISLMAVGVDPFNAATDAPLQLTADRYAKMAEYFAAIGPDGARMMRQTASLQINIGGINPIERWAVANGVAPWMVALFANSSRYAGVDTGFASFRAETWRGVDPGRTGVFRGRDALAEYTAFVLDARAFLVDDAPCFVDLEAELVTETALATHLTTLFPEVRPRGYLELRSLDAVDDAGRRAAMALVIGIVGDATAAAEAFELVGEADESLLRRAGRCGMSDETLSSKAGDLVEIARAGCRRLGASIVSEATLVFLDQALSAPSHMRSISDVNHVNRLEFAPRMP